VLGTVISKTPSRFTLVVDNLCSMYDDASMVISHFYLMKHRFQIGGLNGRKDRPKDQWREELSLGIFRRRDKKLEELCENRV
jgi:hypothetical protein